MLTARYSHNYFDAENRLYPVEMLYTKSDTYTLTLIIPKGYDVEELPKSERIMLNENEGIFEYIVVKKDDVIQLKSKVAFNKAVYAGQDYNKLREFYNHVLRKHNEQIILKKVKT